MAGIRRANYRIFMLRQGFETALEDLQVSEAGQLNRPQGVVPVVRVRFEYQDRQYKFLPMDACHPFAIAKTQQA
jgi:hypothetical protein